MKKRVFDAGDLTLTNDFRDWCRGEMTRFFGNADLTLIEFLMDVSVRSEVADYCQAYMGDKPGACVRQHYCQAYI